MSKDLRPCPQADPDTLGFWDAARERQLRIRRCRSCGTYVHFPSPICSSCGSRVLEWVPVSGRGTVYTYIVVGHALTPGFTPPYVVAWIELPEQQGLRMLSDLVECHPADVSIGMSVEVVFDDLGDCVIPRFRPART